MSRLLMLHWTVGQQKLGRISGFELEPGKAAQHDVSPPGCEIVPRWLDRGLHRIRAMLRASSPTAVYPAVLVLQWTLRVPLNKLAASHTHVRTHVRTCMPASCMAQGPGGEMMLSNGSCGLTSCVVHSATCRVLHRYRIDAQHFGAALVAPCTGLFAIIVHVYISGHGRPLAHAVMSPKNVRFAPRRSGSRHAGTAPDDPADTTPAQHQVQTCASAGLRTGVCWLFVGRSPPRRNLVASEEGTAAGSVLSMIIRQSNRCSRQLQNPSSTRGSLQEETSKRRPKQMTRQ